MNHLEADVRISGHATEPGAPAGAAAGKRWPLFAVLAAQAVFSGILIGHPIVQDEATYADAGNAEIAHWLHGAQILPYSTNFSGAPVIYPPITAALNGIGGLAASRLLSLCFMLITTVLLWCTARRLLGPRVCAVSVTLFAATGAALYLGALATYDAMALMLLAGAAWCAVRACDLYGTRRVLMLVAMCAMLFGANATKYASALWDPAVIAMAGLAEASRRGWGEGWITGLAATIGTLLLLVTGILIGGSAYWQGILFSTLNRTANGGVPPASILASSAAWVGIVAALAVAGAIALSRSSASGPVKAMGWVLTAAVFLAPVNQARIGVAISLFKHVGFGAWFAAIPAGYGALGGWNALLRAWRNATPRRVMAALAAILACIAGIGIFEAQQRSSIPAVYSPTAVAELTPLLDRSKGLWLADSPTVLIYYSHTSPLRWQDTDHRFFYTDPRTGRQLKGAAAFADAVRHHYFHIVVLRSDTRGITADRAIIGALDHSRGYRRTVIPELGSTPARSMFIWHFVGVRRPAFPRRPVLPGQHRRHHRRPGIRQPRQRHRRHRRRPVLLGTAISSRSSRTPEGGTATAALPRPARA